MKIDKVCIIGIFFSLFLLTGCGSDESEPSTPPGPQPSEVEYPEVSEDQRVSITTSLQNMYKYAPTGDIGKMHRRTPSKPSHWLSKTR